MFSKFCQLIMRIIGWKIQGKLPDRAKYIIIVAPHTSNWDFVIGILARGVLDQNINFLAKHQLFIKPWGYLFKALGGSPVNRTKHNNLVNVAVQNFQLRSEYKLALTPEGTRSVVSRWKTGFYHIAKKAQVPIIPIAFDFKNKTIVIANPLYTSDDICNDINQLLDFYRAVKGKHPKDIPNF